MAKQLDDAHDEARALALVEELGAQLGRLKGARLNLETVTVKVKAADRDSLIYALRAYRSYLSNDSGGPEQAR